MNFFKSAVLALGMLLFAHGATYAQAQETSANAQAQAAPTRAPFSDFKAIGAGLVILGAAMGIGKLAAAAVDSMARQPEIAGNIQTAMIIAAALIEGVTFFALIIIIMQVILNR